MKNYSGKDLWNNEVGRKVGERDREGEGGGGGRETVKNHHMEEIREGRTWKCETEVMHGWEER